MEFEDSLCIGNNLKAQNNLQRVRTLPGVLPAGAVCPLLMHTKVPPRAD